MAAKCNQKTSHECYSENEVFILSNQREFRIVKHIVVRCTLITIQQRSHSKINLALTPFFVLLSVTFYIFLTNILLYLLLMFYTLTPATIYLYFRESVFVSLYIRC